MRIETRAGRLKLAIQHVVRKIPRADLARIKAVCVRVSAEQGWHSDNPFHCRPDFNSAEFRRSGTPGAALSEDRGRIVFYLPVLRYFSDEALLGIVAHEFGHARRAATYENLDTFMKVRLTQKYEEEEDLADSFARRWGFGRNLRAMRKEREQVVGPALQSKSARIVHLLRRKEEAEYSDL